MHVAHCIPGMGCATGGVDMATRRARIPATSGVAGVLSCTKPLILRYDG